MIEQSDEAPAVVCTSKKVLGTGFPPRSTKVSILLETPNSLQVIIKY